MMPSHFFKRCLMAVAAALLAACAGPEALREADELARYGQHEAAVQRLVQASLDAPEDARLRLAAIQARERAVAQLMAQAPQGRSDESQAALRGLVERLQAVAPQHPRTLQMQAELQRRQRHALRLAEARQNIEAARLDRAEALLRELLAEDAGHPQARELLNDIELRRREQVRQQATLTLGTGLKPVTLEFRETPLKTVFEALSRAANLNFVFDKDVRGDAKTTVFLRNISVEEALRVILSTQQLGHRLLNENTIQVFPATQQKNRDVLETVTRTFYLVNTDPKQAQALVRTVAKTRDVFIDERLNMMVVRDTPEVVRLIERLIQGLDVAEPEVVLELEVMEVSSKVLDKVGIDLPASASYGLPGSATTVSSASGLSWLVPNPVAVANLRSTRGTSNLLANPTIRARNREKAKVLLGEKRPVFTTTSTANVGVSASVTYLDVGLKLEIEPQVQLDNDVTIKVALEVSSVTNEVTGPQGSIAYQIGTRQASTTLRIRDGETQILAGLINDTESRNSTGLPGLHQIPGVGKLFGTDTDTRDKTEVILLITPRIVRNVQQPASTAGFLPSGTEAQPGLAPLSLRPGAKASTAQQRAGLPGSVARPAELAGRPGAPVGGLPDGVTGPEAVMPGASFQVMVHNPQPQPLSTSLVVDTSVLTIASPGGESGRVSVTVPPRSSAPVMLRARPDVKLADTEVSIESGGTPLRLRVRDPATPDPDDPAAQPQGTDAGEPPGVPPNDR
jgi:general secretion pathway protein D